MAKKIKSVKGGKRKTLAVKQDDGNPKKLDIAILLTGLVSLVFAIYTLFSLISYTVNWAQDQSVVASSDLYNMNVEAQTQGGRMGLVWDNFLISKSIDKSVKSSSSRYFCLCFSFATSVTSSTSLSKSCVFLFVFFSVIKKKIM